MKQSGFISNKGEDNFSSLQVSDGGVAQKEFTVYSLSNNLYNSKEERYDSDPNSKENKFYNLNQHKNSEPILK